MSYSVPSPSLRQDFPAQLIPFPKSARSVRSEDPPAYDGISSAPAREWRPMMPPDLFCPEIGVNAIAVYGVLALHVNGKTGECWPSYPTICNRVGLSRMSVYRAIKTLEEHGFVLIDNRQLDGRANVYTLPHQRHAHVTSDTTGVSHVYPYPSKPDTPPVSHVYPGGITDIPEPYVSEPDVKKQTTVRARDDFKSTYRETIDADWSKVSSKYQRLHPEFTEGALVSILADAEREVGPLTCDQLRTGLMAAWEAIKRPIEAERSGGMKIRTLRGLSRKIMIERLMEVRS